jgi:hypothetical protein
MGGIILAAIQQQPFTAAAVCEVAVRAAARHNQMHVGATRMFAFLATIACYEVAAPPGSTGSTSSTRSDILAAAVSDSSTRDALLLQFELITTQLKCAASCGSGSVFVGLLNHVTPTCQTVVRLAKLVSRTVGIDSGCDTSNSVSSSSAEEQGVRVGALLPWIHLAGRCLFFAGSQLMLAMKDPAAAHARGLSADAVQGVNKVIQFRNTVEKFWPYTLRVSTVFTSL